MSMELWERFDHWTKRNRIDLQPHQRDFAKWLFTNAALEPEVRNFLYSGVGAGKTYTFEAIEEFMRAQTAKPIPKDITESNI